MLPRLLLLLLVAAASTAQLPVLIVPGTGGNRLQAKLDKSTAPHFFCAKKSDWFDLWLDLKQLAPGAVECWADNIRLQYDTATGKFSNADGVQTRVPCFGDVCGLEYLDIGLKKQSNEFHDIVEAFADRGYVRGETIVSAPYDFRYSAVSNPDNYANRTMSLVEELFERTGQKVVWVSHSMGGLWSHYILSNAPQAWKDKYVDSWVPIAPAYGGTACLLRLFASGDATSVPLVSDKTLRDEQRRYAHLVPTTGGPHTPHIKLSLTICVNCVSYESNFWLLPNSELINDDEVLVSTPSKNYTVHDYPGFFRDIGYADGVQIQSTMPYDLSDPNTRTLVKYGKGKDTPSSHVYENGWEKPTSITYSDGDGTVNLWGLEAGKTKGWRNTAHEEYPGCVSGWCTSTSTSTVARAVWGPNVRIAAMLCFAMGAICCAS